MAKKRKEKMEGVRKVVCGGRIRRASAFLPALLLMTVIFFFSAQQAEASSGASEFLGTRLFAAANGLFGFGWSLQKIAAYAEGSQHALRKTAHFAEYFALGAALFHGFRVNVSVRAKRTVRDVCVRVALPAFLCGAVYAAGDEFHQRFVPGRAGAVGDVFVDAAGALCGVALCALFVLMYAGRARGRRD